MSSPTSTKDAPATKEAASALPGISEDLQAIADDLAKEVEASIGTVNETYLTSALGDVQSAKRRVDSAVPVETA